MPEIYTQKSHQLQLRSRGFPCVSQMLCKWVAGCSAVRLPTRCRLSLLVVMFPRMLIQLQCDPEAELNKLKKPVSGPTTALRCGGSGFLDVQSLRLRCTSLLWRIGLLQPAPTTLAYVSTQVPACDGPLSLPTRLWSCQLADPKILATHTARFLYSTGTGWLAGSFAASRVPKDRRLDPARARARTEHMLELGMHTPGSGLPQALALRATACATTTP